MADSKSSGIDPKLANILNWLFAPLSSILFLVIEKEDKEVQIQAWQSLIWGGIAIFLSFTGIWICVYYIVLIWAIVQIAQDQKFRLPVIGEWAEKQVMGSK